MQPKRAGNSGRYFRQRRRHFAQNASCTSGSQNENGRLKNEHELAAKNVRVYNLLVHITYDRAKNQRNIAERNLSFDQAVEFDFETAHIHVDERKNYGETRYVALGLIHGRLHVMALLKCLVASASSVCARPTPVR